MEVEVIVEGGKEKEITYTPLYVGRNGGACGTIGLTNSRSSSDFRNSFENGTFLKLHNGDMLNSQMLNSLMNIFTPNLVLDFNKVSKEFSDFISGQIKAVRGGKGKGFWNKEFECAGYKGELTIHPGNRGDSAELTLYKQGFNMATREIKRTDKFVFTLKGYEFSKKDEFILKSFRYFKNGQCTDVTIQPHKNGGAKKIRESWKSAEDFTPQGYRILGKVRGDIAFVSEEFELINGQLVTKNSRFYSCNMLGIGRFVTEEQFIKDMNESFTNEDGVEFLSSISFERSMLDKEERDRWYKR